MVIETVLAAPFTDDANWAALASARGVPLPHVSTPLATGSMERWLRRLGVSRTAYLKATGYRAVGDFIRLNPGWTLRAWVGLLLEADETALLLPVGAGNRGELGHAP